MEEIEKGGVAANLEEDYKDTEFSVNINDTILCLPAPAEKNIVEATTEQPVSNTICDNERQEPQGFPTWAMPNDTQELIEAASNVYGLPPQMFALPILTAMGVAIGNKAAFKWKDYTNYPQIWGAVIGESGTNKTLPGNLAYKPIRELEQENYEVYNREKAAHTNAGNNITPKPILRHLTTQDSTFEGLTAEMKNNGGMMCFNPDELDSFFQSIAGRYKTSSDVGHYLSMYSNQQISIHRASKDKEPILIKTPILSIYGTIQPEVFKRSIDRLNLTDSGFLQRFIFVYPENIVEPPESDLVIPEAIISGYSAFIKSLFQGNCRKVYEIDVAAKPEFVTYLNKFIDKRNESTGNSFLRSTLAKLEISFHRLCLIIEHTNNKGTTDTISLYSVRCAWSLIRFFLKESGKIDKLIRSNKGEIKMGGGGISKPDMCRYLKKEYPNKKDIEIAEFLGMSKQNFYEHCKK